jgi:hypothetical protein
MCRSLAFLVFVVSLSAAPAPKAKGPPSYQPTGVGARWEYDDGDRGWTEEVTKAETKDGETVLTIQFGGQPGRLASERTVAVSGAGVFNRSTGKFTYDPVCMLKLPAKAGQSWEVSLAPQVGLIGYEGTMTAGAAEKVVVPAGTFEAIPVRLEMVSKNGRKLDEPEVHTWWWAEGVGAVRLQSAGVDRKLKAFTPGKKD